MPLLEAIVEGHVVTQVTSGLCIRTNVFSSEALRTSLLVQSFAASPSLHMVVRYTLCEFSVCQQNQTLQWVQSHVHHEGV
jgi:hypothetical protein